ncbi:HTH_48 domain-containing protein [Trichonephila clavipes]|nr:HTH_48 domain-containing protein [Trichonephila clavipes]
MQRKSPGSPRLKRACISKSKFKVMLIVFDINGIIMIEWVPSGHTVNQYYSEVLKRLCEKIGEKRPQLWSDGWLLHQDNAHAHITLSVKQFLTSKNITVLGHSRYLSDLAPCDFFLFPTVKSCLKGTHFTTVEKVQAKTKNLLKGLSKTLFQNCYQH